MKKILFEFFGLSSTSCIGKKVLIEKNSNNQVLIDAITASNITCEGIASVDLHNVFINTETKNLRYATIDLSQLKTVRMNILVNKKVTSTFSRNLKVEKMYIPKNLETGYYDVYFLVLNLGKKNVLTTIHTTYFAQANSLKFKSPRKWQSK